MAEHPAGRLNTQLESAGAEHLVLGTMMIEGIPSFKAYSSAKGYDLIAVNADANLSCRIQVKSRWQTRPDGFPIKNLETDFVVIALLNRGSKSGKVKATPPAIYVVPIGVIALLPRTDDWGKISFSKFKDMEEYRDRWELVRSFLKLDPESIPSPLSSL